MKLISHYQKKVNRSKNIIENWTDYEVNDSILYSWRNTRYHSNNFPSNLHYHNYFELIIIEEGDIEYICESNVYFPKKGDIILIPPGKFHMSVINAPETQYNRHVFYFYPSAFDAYDCNCLFTFAQAENNGKIMAFSHSEKQEMRILLERINSAFSKTDDKAKRALGISYIIQLFYLINQKSKAEKIDLQVLPDNILKLKDYIDINYASIESVSEVAQHFFYSREHASRLFKKHFDITMFDYILQRRILESQKLILDGVSITDAAYAVGFNSISAFIRGFREKNGLSPSEYRKMNDLNKI